MQGKLTGASAGCSPSLIASTDGATSMEGAVVFLRGLEAPKQHTVRQQSMGAEQQFAALLLNGGPVQAAARHPPDGTNERSIQVSVIVLF